jgi:cytochrome c biogenesis protein CcdA
MIERLVLDFATLLPFGYAFGVGMVTAVSPCGIAMLPVYISLHLGTAEDSYWSRHRLRRVGRALLMSAVVTAAFVAFFGIMGAVLSLGGQAISGVIPWVAVVVGALLIPLGIYVVAGGHVYSSLPARLAARIGRSEKVGVRGFLVFGIAYAIAALSCTLPVFMVVVAGAIDTRGFAVGLLQFISFALGMGFIIAIVTVASSLLRETVHLWLRRLAPAVARLSGLLLVFAGGYLIWYWLVVGDILG